MQQNDSQGLSYRDAGVDIDAGNELVERIKPAVRRTMRPEVLTGLGGFGALFRIDPARWNEPLLVSGPVAQHAGGLPASTSSPAT